jgi:glycosyltransferase involved in cell wall biosynthesis
MRREQYTVVHCHSTKAGLLGRLAAWMSGVPVVVFTARGWSFVGDWRFPLRRVMIAAERLAARLSTAIICVSSYDRQIALRLGIGQPDRLVVIHNGVDPSPWLGNRQAPDPSAGQRPSTAVMVGRLTVQKDPATLLEAWKDVNTPHRLLIVGDGPFLSDVQRQIQRNGLADRVALLDSTSDIPTLLWKADVFVQCSRWEGLPLAIIEAMMSGLPVIATSVGGVAEVVEVGVTGLLVPPKNPKALSSALNHLLHDPGLRARMGEAGRRRALGHFTEARMLAETVQVYDGAIRKTVQAVENP